MMMMISRLDMIHHLNGIYGIMAFMVLWRLWYYGIMVFKLDLVYFINRCHNKSSTTLDVSAAKN